MDEITQKLILIFQIVNDWLKDSEAKNGILFAFSGGAITANLAYLRSSKIISKYVLFGISFSLIFLCICSLICALSFLPRTNLERIVWLRNKPSKKIRSLQNNTDNFYFFGHLLKYESDELLDSPNQLYFHNKLQKPYKKEYLDIASQIIVNSEITFLKFKFFSFALWILIVSIITVPISLLISLIFLRHI